MSIKIHGFFRHLLLATLATSFRRLVDHLVEAGKRAVPLEKRAEKEVAWALFPAAC